MLPTLIGMPMPSKSWGFCSERNAPGTLQNLRFRCFQKILNFLRSWQSICDSPWIMPASATRWSKESKPSAFGRLRSASQTIQNRRRTCWARGMVTSWFKRARWSGVSGVLSGPLLVDFGWPRDVNFRPRTLEHARKTDWSQSALLEVLRRSLRELHFLACQAESVWGGFVRKKGIRALREPWTKPAGEVEESERQLKRALK